MAEYKPPITPAEIRISDKGWESFLEQWEKELLLIVKQTFLEYILGYEAFGVYIHDVKDHILKLDLSRNVCTDMLRYPGRDAHEQAEGERRLKESRKRLAYLLERLPKTQLTLEHQMILRDSLRYPGASEEDIAAAEARLGLRFPPSYRQFLTITNGWLIKDRPLLWPVEKVAPLRELAPKYLKIWREHEFLHDTVEFVVTPQPLGEGERFVSRRLDIPTASLESALVIGSEHDEEASFLILDPTVVDEQGEWRAIILYRYEYTIVGRDFRRAMEILYRMTAKRYPD